jgi:hypothetical protein
LWVYVGESVKAAGVDQARNDPGVLVGNRDRGFIERALAGLGERPLPRWLASSINAVAV